MNQRELLIKGAAELNVTLSSGQVEALLLHLSELAKWNRKINLTSITDGRDMVIKHALDSLSYLRGFAPMPGLRLLDLGSGAGFPAIPIRIACADASATLVESVKKKASFLRHIIRVLGLTRTEVLDVRAEAVPEHYENTYSIVTARAFADIGSAVSIATRFLRPGGLIVLSRGPEETVSDKALAQAGVTLEKRSAFQLPLSDHKRCLWVLRKRGGTEHVP